MRSGADGNCRCLPLNCNDVWFWAGIIFDCWLIRIWKMFSFLLLPSSSSSTASTPVSGQTWQMQTLLIACECRYPRASPTNFSSPSFFSFLFFSKPFFPSPFLLLVAATFSFPASSGSHNFVPFLSFACVIMALWRRAWARCSYFSSLLLLLLPSLLLLLLFCLFCSH